MAAPLRVLLIEDCTADADLIVSALRRGGYDALWERVDTADDLRSALARQAWDIVTCDYEMPRFDAPAALGLIRSANADLPVILVSGEVSESSAATALKGGAHDFVSKDNLARLVPAVERELREAEMRVARRRAEAALRLSELRYRTVVETSHDIIWSTDANGRIVYVNQAVQSILGYTPGEMIGRSFFDFVKPDDVERSLHLFRETKGGRRQFGQELELRCKDGTAVLVSANATVLTDADGSAVGAAGTLADVTQARRLAQQASQAHKLEAIARLAGCVAHDFNNHLTVIKGSLQLLLTALPIGDPRRRDAERIDVTIDKSMQLVRQLLTFSRGPLLAARRLDLHDVVDDMTPMLRLLLGEAIALEVAVAPDLWPLHADRTQLGQVITNLVANARDALVAAESRCPDARVTIEAHNVTLERPLAQVFGGDHRPGAYVKISVSDTGAGMSRDVQEHIFEPFFTTKGGGEGTGLGLATVLGIVRQHGGQVGCRSEPDKGTTFDVYLPRDQSGEDSGPTRVAARGWRGGRPPTVLVGEDDDSVRELLVRCLKDAAYHVHAAANVEDALALAACLVHPIDLLVTDLVLPGGSTRALVRTLLGVHPQMRVLFVSGHPAQAVDLSALAGARFLSKPFDLQELRAAVAAILGDASSGDET